ncbi:DUF1127 domain-containing protein [Marinibacterium profundimaris]|uniref:YjiS-like domain-containing protein n=1 Tax=Marinibacterium profundimaris TaxID=1679460 RepID=A0A225NXW1_9RHOB|nr:DUF1127 domain-containing protein [Marinibacterium profundimaris]OWU77988.1 hypothetical protein ATO3_05005 [Marinibacterium profundimaris]
MSKQIALTAPMAHEPALLRTLVDRFSARRARNKVYRETLAELRALSDRDLRDLGMSRASIHSVAWEAAAGAR